jgi:hypothetical protein
MVHTGARAFSVNQFTAHANCYSMMVMSMCWFARLCGSLPSQHITVQPDVAFFVAARKADIEAELRARDAQSKTMSVAQRVEVESLRLQCDEHVVTSKRLQAAFWAELSKPTPSTTALDSIGAEFHRAVGRATAAFEGMLRLTASPSIMHRYASFLSEVSTVDTFDAMCTFAAISVA